MTPEQANYLYGANIPIMRTDNQPGIIIEDGRFVINIRINGARYPFGSYSDLEEAKAQHLKVLAMLN